MNISYTTIRNKILTKLEGKLSYALTCKIQHQNS